MDMDLVFYILSEEKIPTLEKRCKHYFYDLGKNATVLDN
jgi:hypothetical protein